MWAEIGTQCNRLSWTQERELRRWMQTLYERQRDIKSQRAEGDKIVERHMQRDSETETEKDRQHK